MATPADQRLLELLDKWLKSLELHTTYASLDDESYWKIQPWVEHQRPSLWIINLAKQKAQALRTHVQERVAMGDAKYSDSLELMTFLANLVGSEHIERFIPMADADNERSLSRQRPLTAAAASDTVEQPAPDVPARASANSVTATREMPKFLGAKRAPPAQSTTHIARTERKAAAQPKPAARPNKQPPRLGAAATAAPPVKPKVKAAVSSDRDAPSDVIRAQVIADAARLVQWGRKWYELPELIARMAGRPSLPDVRRILKENKSAIDAKPGALRDPVA